MQIIEVEAVCCCSFRYQEEDTCGDGCMTAYPGDDMCTLLEGTCEGLNMGKCPFVDNKAITVRLKV